MEALWDMLQAVRLSGAVFLDARFTAPWCVRSQVEPEDCRPFGGMPPQVVAYHYVIEGELVVESEGGGTPPQAARAGDIVLLPRNDPHRLASAPGLAPVDAGPLVSAPPGGQGLARIVLGGNGPATRICCGFLGSDTRAARLLDSLPPVMVLPVREAAQWIESSFRFAAETLATGGPESSVVLSRLADLLFVEAIRRYVAALPPDATGWIAGLADPVVGRALAVLHGDPVRAWRIEALARETGASRSVLAERFTRLVGEPPMRYLARLRLERAAARLQDEGVSVMAAALSAGYDSEAAFSRAFKRAYGMPPAAWRRQERPRPGL